MQGLKCKQCNRTLTMRNVGKDINNRIIDDSRHYLYQGIHCRGVYPSSEAAQEAASILGIGTYAINDIPPGKLYGG